MSFSFLCCCSPYLSGTECGQIFHFFSAASNALLKPGGLLRWKVGFVKDARLSLPLTEVMNISRLTSPLLDVTRESSPRPSMRHGRRLALLSHLNITLNLCTLFFTLSPAHLPRLPPLLISKLFFPHGIGFGLSRLPEISLFCFSAKGSE